MKSVADINIDLLLSVCGQVFDSRERAVRDLYSLALQYYFVIFIIDDKEDRYKIVSDYQATNIGEISLSEGGEVTIIEKNERGIVL